MRKEISKLGVVITTYNKPHWLEKVLHGYTLQNEPNFTILIADDGSDDRTRKIITHYKKIFHLDIQHVWHEDKGFRKTKILNQAILTTDCDYLIFTDDDCIPRKDFVSTHKTLAQDGRFLSGGYFKLTTPVSERITLEDINAQRCFSPSWLKKHGQPISHKFLKFVPYTWLQNLFNWITPTKPTWNGMNSSTWKAHILAVNGFNEDMQYGGLDRELGERLVNFGITGKQVRYKAICVHLDHARGYKNQDTITKNKAIRAHVRKEKVVWTKNGLTKSGLVE